MRNKIVPIIFCLLFILGASIFVSNNMRVVKIPAQVLVRENPEYKVKFSSDREEKGKIEIIKGDVVSETLETDFGNSSYFESAISSDFKFLIASNFLKEGSNPLKYSPVFYDLEAEEILKVDPKFLDIINKQRTNDDIVVDYAWASDNQTVYTFPRIANEEFPSNLIYILKYNENNKILELKKTVKLDKAISYTILGYSDEGDLRIRVIESFKDSQGGGIILDEYYDAIVDIEGGIQRT